MKINQILFLFIFAVALLMPFSTAWGASKFNCGGCQKEVDATARKCPHCGAQFEDFECSKCHKVISTSSKVCPHCGNTFSDSTGYKNYNENNNKNGGTKRASDPSAKKVSISDRFFYDLYFRISARSDMGHGSKTLGWWPLYGRLMNETNWFTFGLGFNLMDQEKKSDPGARLYMRVEGNSVRTGDEGAGSLGNFSFTQFYLETTNIPSKNFVVQAGTLWYNMGYIGIYDFYVAQSLWETVGVRLGMRHDNMEWFIGLGDSGYSALKERQKTYPDAGYNSIPTLAGIFKVKLGKNFWVGSSAMMRYEMSEEGNPNSPHKTDVDYRDVLRGDVLKKYIDNNPTDPNADSFPGATSLSDLSWRLTFWMGFNAKSLGLQWNDLSISFENSPAELARRFTYNGITKDVYVSGFSDERYDLTIADESQWVLVKDKLDLILAGAFGYAMDNDNKYLPDDRNRMILSLVMRPQYYITEHFHFLTELSMAVEKSLKGNRYREHYDSIQANTGGVPDPDGLEWGDTDTKYTFQFKTGLVFNPAGRGIYKRPAIRLLFGVQYSNVHAAFSNSYNESLNRQNTFNKREDIHWHYMISLEVEHWF